MNKKIFLSILLFLGAAMAMADVAPNIYGITVKCSVGDGYTVFKNETVHVRWNHSGFYTNPGQTCRIFCDGHVISPPVPVIGKDFTWTGGRKLDGTYIPQGRPYRITIESDDYDALNGPDIALVYEQPNFTIIAPANNAMLVVGTSVTIRWTHSAYYDVFNTAKIELLIANSDLSVADYIASVPVVDDQFVWQAGRMKNGSIAPTGSYLLTGEQNEYWQCNDVHFKLISLARPLFRLFMEKIHLDKIPDCPMCYRLDPRQIKFDRGDLPWVDVELLRNGVVLAKLGRFGPRSVIPAPVKIVLGQASAGKLVRRQMDKYELRFLSPKGETVHRQAIPLELGK